MEERVLHAEGGKLPSTLPLSAEIRMARICAGGLIGLQPSELTKASAKYNPP